MVGSIQYLVKCTRPDLAFPVRVLSKFLTCYTTAHYELAARVLLYIKGTAGYGLVFRINPSTSQSVLIEGYSDADLGNDLDTRRSTTGFIVQACGCTFAYGSKAQSTVVDNTCSAERVAASKCADVIKSTMNLLIKLGVKHELVCYTATTRVQYKAC